MSHKLHTTTCEHHQCPCTYRAVDHREPHPRYGCRGDGPARRRRLRQRPWHPTFNPTLARPRPPSVITSHAASPQRPQRRTLTSPQLKPWADVPPPPPAGVQAHPPPSHPPHAQPGGAPVAGTHRRRNRGKGGKSLRQRLLRAQRHQDSLLGRLDLSDAAAHTSKQKKLRRSLVWVQRKIRCLEQQLQLQQASKQH